MLDGASANRLKNAGSTPKPPSMSSGTHGLHTGSTTDSLGSQVAESPSVVKLTSNDDGATMAGAVAGKFDVFSVSTTLYVDWQSGGYHQDACTVVHVYKGDIIIVF